MTQAPLRDGRPQTRPTSNVLWHDGIVDRDARWRRLGQRGATQIGVDDDAGAVQDTAWAAAKVPGGAREEVVVLRDEVVVLRDACQ